MEKNTFTYNIDNNDRIIGVSENWDGFAFRNSANENIYSEKLIGKSIWSFINHMETQHLYKHLVKKAREGKKISPIPFRCDAPDKKRYQELIITKIDEDRIQITSRVLKTENREPLWIYNKEVKRSGKMLKICSMCKKVETAKNRWMEIEEWLVDQQLFLGDSIPELSHGLCYQCYNEAMRELAE